MKMKKAAMLIKKKENWGRFFTKLIIVIILFCILIYWFRCNFQLGVDPQRNQCLPEHSVYLISKHKSFEDMKRGELYAFKSMNMQPFFSDDITVVKIMVALPGDLVEIKENTDIFVNGNKISDGLFLAEKLSIPIGSFIGKKVLGKDEFWFLGKTKESFDSRYWGSVNYAQIIGKAYPLF